MSSHLRFAAFLHLLCFGLVAVGADPVLFSICSSSGSGNYSSLYSSDLKKLESYLPKQTPWVGFSLASVGSGQDQANGPACPVPRGCMSTLQTAEHAFQRQGMRSINKLCQNSRGGVIWYDSCLFKYSDQEFFGQIDNQNKFFMWNLNNVTTDPTAPFDGSSTAAIYGLAQCTRDLSYGDCKKCLDEAISELPSCCNGRQGGRVVGGSCNVRYEIYPFVKT
ncbi:hypothetical protein Dimus_037542 [Dionaea muscipula]